MQRLVHYRRAILRNRDDWATLLLAEGLPLCQDRLDVGLELLRVATLDGRAKRRTKADLILRAADRSDCKDGQLLCELQLPRLRLLYNCLDVLIRCWGVVASSLKADEADAGAAATSCDADGCCAGGPEAGESSTFIGAGAGGAAGEEPKSGAVVASGIGFGFGALRKGAHMRESASFFCPFLSGSNVLEARAALRV